MLYFNTIFPENQTGECSLWFTAIQYWREGGDEYAIT